VTGYNNGVFIVNNEKMSIYFLASKYQLSHMRKHEEEHSDDSCRLIRDSELVNLNVLHGDAVFKLPVHDEVGVGGVFPVALAHVQEDVVPLRAAVVAKTAPEQTRFEKWITTLILSYTQ
jgi:hypothetical protein